MAGKGIELLNRAKTIRVLDFSGRLDDDAFLSLEPNPQLRHLGLRMAAITDRSMPHMQGFPRLRILDLRAASISDDGLASLAALHFSRSLTLA